jgi:hypothetical protein
MQGIPLEELTDKERAQIRKEKEKTVARVDALVVAKDKSDEQILKEMYALCREKVSTKMKKEKEITLSMRRAETAALEKVNMGKDAERLKKEAGTLKSLVEVLEKQNEVLQEEHKKLVEAEQKKRLELNDQMQLEIKETQKTLEEELQRKAQLSNENEELAKRIQELKLMFQTTRDNIEKTLGNSEFDMSSIEERLRQNIETETAKLVVRP